MDPQNPFQPEHRPPPEYQPPEKFWAAPPQRLSTNGQLVGGLLIGALVSLVVYAALPKLICTTLVLVGSAKVTVGAICLRKPNMVGFGRGLLISLLLGGLISFGMCARSIFPH